MGLGPGFNIKTINDNFALVLIIAFTGKQSSVLSVLFITT
jgi:hypothetical protein